LIVEQTQQETSRNKDQIHTTAPRLTTGSIEQSRVFLTSIALFLLKQTIENFCAAFERDCCVRVGANERHKSILIEVGGEVV
jgi:hypothetical protein